MLAKIIDPKLEQYALQLARAEWDQPQLKPLGQYLAGMVSVPDQVCKVGTHWFAVNTEPKQERLAREEIGDRGLVPYLPLVPKQVPHGRGQTRTVESPMFTSYLFVRCNPTPDDWHLITSARGVHRLVDGAGAPATIAEGAIEVVRLTEATFEQPEQRSQLIWHFSPGDIVRIKEGPFAGFLAKLESAVDEHERLKALISIFGRASRADLSAHQIEAL